MAQHPAGIGKAGSLPGLREFSRIWVEAKVEAQRNTTRER